MNAKEWPETPKTSVHGMDVPLYVRAVWTERQGALAIELRDGRTLYVDKTGFELHRDIAYPPVAAYTIESPAPLHGYILQSAFCEQTGGMCMVDVLRLENGLCVTITDDFAVLQWSCDWDCGAGDSLANLNLIESQPEPEIHAHPVMQAIIRAMDDAEACGATASKAEYIAIMRAVEMEAATRAHNAENA